VHKVASDPLVVREFTSGLYLNAVGLVTAKNRTVLINISLDKRIVDIIDAVAQMRGLPISGFLTEAAQNEIREP